MSNQEDIGIDAGWEAVRWSICLATPPQIASFGVGMHGFLGKERYLLPDLWCLHLYPYTATLRLAERVYPIRPGFAGITPPNIPIEYDYAAVSQHLFVHFRCGSGSITEPIAAMQDLGPDFPHFYNRLEAVVKGVGLPQHRAQARLWDILCELTERSTTVSPSAPPHHRAVQHTVSQIALRLGEPLSVSELAREADVSYSYLGRLFQAAYGTTVVAYIRDRRMEHAEHLLRHSTLPIKVIAATVGIPDLHLFNKTVRQTFGKSPRALRQKIASPVS